MIRKLNRTYDDLDKKYYLQTFKRYPLTFDHGKGSRIWDVEGNEYIDMLGGIAVNSVGHSSLAPKKTGVKFQILNS
ncbi:aminotransferase class III-fold pyridoxal phosphate-dependent enzyme [Ancylomarina sp.]|uniref:aminotransferase class III-fold pyridoxal phosphate-dependent enzyme n=1 Tax=Ancylomarina sp. TaxID=1970196 RepID=UPI0035644C1C